MTYSTMDYIFTGMKHCGKSSIGQAWAKCIDAPFYDTDDIILDEYRKGNALAKGNGSAETLREIFISQGSDFLKARELDLMHRLNEEILPQSENNVISLGGGLPVNYDLIDLLRRLETVVYLKDSLKRLYERVAATGNVPFLKKENPEEHFYELCKIREGYYILHADLIIDLDHLSLEEAKAKVISQLKSIK
jgi:shikimate kinase